MISVKEWAMVKILQEQGVSKIGIARRLAIDRKTVSRALQRKEVPFYPTGSCKDSGPRRASKLDPYKEYIGCYIQQRFERYEKLSATKLYLEIEERGYQGSYETVKRYSVDAHPPLLTRSKKVSVSMILMPRCSLITRRSSSSLTM